MSLQNELKMNQGFASLNQEALLSLTRTYLLLDPHLNAILNNYKITSSQFNILRILRGNKSSEGMSCTDISDRMMTRDSDITRLLDKLDKAKLIERYRPEEDRRKVLSQITKNGLDLVEEISPQLDDCNNKLMSHMDDESLQQLIDLLAKLRSPLL